MMDFKARASWRGGLSALSDAEAGRFCKALWDYAATGEVRCLDGREGVLLQMCLEELRMEEAKREATRARRSEAGKAGGQAKASKSSKCQQMLANLANASNASNCYTDKQLLANLANASNASNCQQEKERKDPLSPFPHTPNPYIPQKKEKEDARACARGDGSLSAEEGAALAEDLQAVYAAAEHAGFPGDAATAEKLTLMVGEHGADAVLAAIDAANDQGKTSLTYLRGILRNRSAPKADDFIPALTFD